MFPVHLESKAETFLFSGCISAAIAFASGRTIAFLDSLLLAVTSRKFSRRFIPAAISFPCASAGICFTGTVIESGAHSLSAARGEDKRKTQEQSENKGETIAEPHSGLNLRVFR